MAFYDNYGVRFFGQFDSIPRNGGTSDYYFFTISEKDYLNRGAIIDLDRFGNADPLLLAKSPVIHTWLDDSPKPYIKGSEVSITYINSDNLLPLDTFYSEEDDKYKIDLYVRINDGTSLFSKRLFSGYLVQEDCSEEESDIAHEINLVFTDGLGLLKNINLVDAINQTQKLGTTRIVSGAFINIQSDNNIKYLVFSNFAYGPPEIGQGLIIKNIPNGDLIYSVTKVAGNKVYVNEELPDSLPSVNLTYYIFTKYEQSDLVKLIDIYWICNYALGIPLQFAFANMLNEKSETPPVGQSRILEYVYLKLDTFIDTNQSDSLDEVLNKINYRLGCSLFQSDGRWNLVRWNELRNTGTYDFISEPINRLYADFYSTEFVWQSRDYLTNTRDIANGSDIEYGVLKSIERPLKYIRHTFKYEFPDEILYNKDFNEVGDLISETVINGNTYKRYVAKGWTGNLPPTANRGNPDRFIEVVYDSFMRETDRYLLITNGNLTYDQRWNYLQNFVSNTVAIPINKGDVIKLTYECKADQNYSGIVSSKVWFGLTTNPNNINTYFMLNNNGTWLQNPLVYITLDFNNNFGDWQTKSIESKPAPFDGVAYLSFTPFGGGVEGTLYRGISFSIESIENNRNINGHEHKTSIPQIIKNKEEEQIYIDDSLKNNINGTLFLGSSTGVLRNKTSQWNDGRVNLNVSLGEIITRQENLWRNKRRLKLEGNLWPILKGQNTPSFHIISMLNVLNYLIENKTYLVFGKLEIDYKENQSNFTAFEMWRWGEQWWDTKNQINVPLGIYKDPNMIYTFKYLYK